MICTSQRMTCRSLADDFYVAVEGSYIAVDELHTEVDGLHIVVDDLNIAVDDLCITGGRLSGAGNRGFGAVDTCGVSGIEGREGLEGKKDEGMPDGIPSTFKSGRGSSWSTAFPFFLFGVRCAASCGSSLGPGVTPSFFGEIESRSDKDVGRAHSDHFEDSRDLVEEEDELCLEDLPFRNHRFAAKHRLVIHRVVFVRCREIRLRQRRIGPPDRVREPVFVSQCSSHLLVGPMKLSWPEVPIVP